MSKPVIQLIKNDGTVKVGLVDRTISDIRAYIRNEKMQAGEPFPSETALAKKLGVSRAVTREAFRALSALKIIETGNGRRARVAEPDADALSLIIEHTVYTKQLSIQQVLDVRRTLEIRTVNLATLRRTEAQAKELLDIISQMFKNLENPETVMDLDIRFHEIIAQASGNSLYSIIVDSFRVITKQTWHIGWISRNSYENRKANIECHERIAIAIMAQDPARAEKAMNEHFDSAISVLLNAGIT